MSEFRDRLSLIRNILNSFELEYLRAEATGYIAEHTTYRSITYVLRCLSLDPLIRGAVNSTNKVDIRARSPSFWWIIMTISGDCA